MTAKLVLGLYGPSPRGPITVVATADPHATHTELKRRFWPYRLLAVMPTRRRDAQAIVTALGGKPQAFIRLSLESVRQMILVEMLSLPAILPKAEAPDSVAPEVQRLPDAPRPADKTATASWYVAIYGEKYNGPVRVILTENPRKTGAEIKRAYPLYRQLAVEPLHPNTEEVVRLGLKQAFKGEGKSGGQYPMTAGRAVLLARTVIESAVRLGKKVFV